MSRDKSSNPGNLIRFRPARDCPECGLASQTRYYPFCSRRCVDLDLNRWLSGSYAIAGEPMENGTPGEDEGHVGPDEKQTE